MKKKLFQSYKVIGLLVVCCSFFTKKSFADVTLTTAPIAAANIAQGSPANIVYAVRMDVSGTAVVVSSIQFTLNGTHDNNDLTVLNIYMNFTAPSLSGAFLLANNIPATFAAPHTYSASFFFGGPQNISAGGSAYIIVTAALDASATSGNTIKVNGASNPAVLGFTTSPVIINNQTDLAGTQTILASGVTLTTSPVPAANIAQGSATNIVYAMKMDVTDFAVVVNNIQFTLSGTHDNNDLTVLNIFMNFTSPSLSGAFLLANNIPAAFAAPHTYNTSFFFSGPQTITAGGTAYIIVTATLSASATSGNTIKVNGATNPAVLAFTTSPTITDNQSDNAGTQTILAPGITLTTSSIAAANIMQGAANNIVYAARMDVTGSPVTVNNIQFTLGGTHDNNDLTAVSVYLNPTGPSLTGAFVVVNNIPATFAAPHTYSTPLSFSGPQTIAAGGTAYFIITVSLDAAATTGNTIKVDGAANPVVLGFTTSPPVINNQTDAAGVQTIGGVLPLTLINFTAGITDVQYAILKWTTAQEVNTGKFEIEWSADGRQFIKISTQQAAGNSSSVSQYSYLHANPVPGNNYYRLKMVDADGRFTYSTVIKLISNLSSPVVTVFPNPVADIMHLDVKAMKSETTTFYLYNSEGKQVDSRPVNLVKGSNLFIWNLQGLSPGIYFLKECKTKFKPVSIIKQ